MKVKNLTPFVFGAKVTSRHPPEPEMVLVVRGAFALRPGQPVAPLGGDGDLLAQGAMTGDVFRDDDPDRVGECLYASDFADWKPRAEVLLRGTCHTPGGKPLTECPVRFVVGAFSKTLRVIGRRVWSDGWGGAAMSAPIPFTTMPLDWAHAFGGPGFPKNPAGKGITSAELPNLEDPRFPLKSKADRPEPVGFGPISPEWPARQGKRGTQYGKAYQDKRAPYYAEDFDWTHFNAAPADQQLQGFLRGDERLELTNLYAETHSLEVRLPGLRLRAFVKDTAGRFREVGMSLDTLLADTDAGTLYLTWRGLDGVKTDDLVDVAFLLLASEPLADEPLPEAHYRARLEAFERDPLGLEEHKLEGMPDQAEAEKKLAAMQAAADEAKEGASAGPEAAGKVLGALLKIMSPPGAAELGKSVAALGAAVGKHQPDAPLGKAIQAGYEVKPATRSPADIAPGANPQLLPPGQAASKAMKEQLAAAKKAAADKGQPLPKEVDEALAHPMFASASDVPPPAPGPGVDLTGRDFSGHDLRGADFRGANLTQTRFTGCRLDGALFGGAVLFQAILADAQLTNADFSEANLDSANLSGTSAEGACFRGARLDRTMFDGAKLSGVDFGKARGVTTLFQNATLEGALFRGVQLERALFGEGKADKVDFSDASLVGCLFSKQALPGARFERALLDKTSFVESDLTGAAFVEARGEVVTFQKATLRGTDLSYSTLRKSHFSEAEAQGARFFAANLRESRFYRAMLRDADFTTANLFAADFGKAELSGARFRHASLFDARLVGASGAGADFVGANLRRSTLEKA